jgi:hypothetical protein
MTTAKARQIVLAARPQGRPKLTDFRPPNSCARSVLASRTAASVIVKTSSTVWRKRPRPSSGCSRDGTSARLSYASEHSRTGMSKNTIDPWCAEIVSVIERDAASKREENQCQHT